MSFSKNWLSLLIPSRHPLNVEKDFVLYFQFLQGFRCSSIFGWVQIYILMEGVHALGDHCHVLLGLILAGRHHLNHDLSNGHHHNHHSQISVVITMHQSSKLPKQIHQIKTELGQETPARTGLGSTTVSKRIPFEILHQFPSHLIPWCHPPLPSCPPGACRGHSWLWFC